jgi:glutathione peroxidase
MIQFLMIAMLMINTGDGVHSFELNSINGEKVDLSEYKGKVLLIVNTASECGFTRQYSGLQELHEAYSEKGLVILGFPANNFAGQEPGTDEEILEFCERNFGVTFPLFSKVSVRGDDIHPMFQFLTSADNPDFEGDIRWNFEKFLVDQDGNLIRRFRSGTEPMSEEMIEAVESLLD